MDKGQMTPVRTLNEFMEWTAQFNQGRILV